MKPGSHHYILDENRQLISVGLLEWARWFEVFENRRVAETLTLTCRISTVFLGLDHQWGKGPPLVFETMVFDLTEIEYELKDGEKFTGHEDLECFRYSTWDDAEAGHKATVRRIERLEAEAGVKIKTSRKHEEPNGH